MKVYKGENFNEALTRLESEDKYPEEGDIFVTRSEEFGPNNEKWTVWHHRVRGVFDPRAEFKRLKDATKFALSMEKPTLMENGYQVIKLSAESSLCVYYQQYQDVANTLAYNLGMKPEEDSDMIYHLGQSGIRARMIVDKKVLDTNAMYGLHANLLDEFTRYLTSDERRKRFEAHPEPPNGLSIEERMADVGNWDVQNFLFDRMNGIEY